MTDELDTIIRQFVDGDLDAEDERVALRRIAEDDAARNLLRFELQVRRTWTLVSAPEVPDGFADRTMAAVEDETMAESVLLRRVQRFWTWLTTPQPVALRPAFGLVAVVLVAVLIGGVLSFGPARLSPSTTPSDAPVATTASTAQATQTEAPVVWTRFTYINNEASSVAVAGDFSEWEPIPLSAETVDGETVWTGLVPVSKGEHQYMFVVDGSEWVTDPLAPVQREDGFGHRNAVLRL